MRLQDRVALVTGGGSAHHVEQQGGPLREKADTCIMEILSDEGIQTHLDMTQRAPPCC